MSAEYAIRSDAQARLTLTARLLYEQQTEAFQAVLRARSSGQAGFQEKRDNQRFFEEAILSASTLTERSRGEK